MATTRAPNATNSSTRCPTLAPTSKTRVPGATNRPYSVSRRRLCERARSRVQHHRRGGRALARGQVTLPACGPIPGRAGGPSLPRLVSALLAKGRANDSTNMAKRRAPMAPARLLGQASAREDLRETMVVGALAQHAPVPGLGNGCAALVILEPVDDLLGQIRRVLVEADSRPGSK